MTSKRLRQFISMVLVVCLCFVLAAPTLAAGGFGSESRSRWGGCLGNTSGQDETPENDSSMTLIEDETTLENSEGLRASTYELLSASGSSSEVSTRAASGTTLKYFKVTMYDYDANTINNATYQAEVDEGLKTKWEGIYFNDGNPGNGTYTYNTDSEAGYVLQSGGQYYIQCARASQNNAASWLRATTSGVSAVSDKNNATLWTLTKSGSNYYLSCTYNNRTYYLYIGRGTGSTYLTTSAYALNLSAYGGNLSTTTYSNTIQISRTTSNYYYSTTYYLNHYNNGGTGNSYGGYTSANDAGNAMRFIDADGNQYSLGSSSSQTITKAFADWNFWNKGSGSNNNGQKFYTGLVEPQLDANKDIVFTKPEGGIFNSDESVKSIYTNVEMPFAYEDGTYTFDASQNGVYFHTNTSQGSSGTAASGARLYFNKGNTQSNNATYGDGSSTMWLPFNDGTSVSGEANCNYHFGMRTTIPFSMTTNGRLDASDDSSDAIKFSFSGDDDVWVFIDGQLVIDLGGIHNRLDAEINFADNTVKYSESNSLSISTGSYNDSTFKNTQTLFDNLISQDSATFAATDEHELTIFYLERGKGSSNSKIQFNLPVKDYVSVQKMIDGAVTVSGNNVTQTKTWDQLTESQKAVLNNQEFTFTLYKNGQPVANRTYSRLSSNNQVIATPQTDANGQFVLKNGETAKFIGTIDTGDGASYYVVENVKDGFIQTKYEYTADAASDNTTTGTNTITYYEQSGSHYVTDKDYGPLTSPTYSVVGGAEREDSLNIVCKNYMNASMPNPSAITNDETVVLDYGLSVDIDITSNNLVLADRSEITFPDYVYDEDNGVYTAEYGTFTFDAVAGKITYTLNKELTGVERINYTLTGYSQSDGGGAEVSASDTGTTTIIPATSMYYEEDFTGLVSYTAGDWKAVGTADTDNQEPGFVGTVNDSPYGSDVAYLNDSGDSNGTSRYVDTTNGAAQFSYEFTGIGTTFFARTTGDSAYMRVQIYDSNNNPVWTGFRDTSYKDANGDLVDLTNNNGAVDADATVLYNIPVFTTDDLDYGTYKVVVTIAKRTVAGNGKLQYGDQFWLDGIRVIDPLGTSRTEASTDDVVTARAAYARDGEANMTVVTLREKLLKDSTAVSESGETVWADDATGFVVFTDTNGEIVEASEYESNGPKEEVYLNDGQSITFSLENWNPNTNKLYLGMKAPNGSGTVTIGNTTINLSNAADCYYEISHFGTINPDANTITFTITADEGALVSVTNIKATGSTQFVIVNQKDLAVDGSNGEEA